jgi:TonB family protein
MRLRGGVLVIVCAGVAFGGAHLGRAQEATSANLPDQFQPWELTPTSKPKKKKADSTSQRLATAPKQTTAPASEQTPVPEELPSQMVTEDKKTEPSRGTIYAPSTEKPEPTPVTEHAPSAEESETAAVPVEKKPRSKKPTRTAVQPETASIPAPVPMSLSVAQSMAVSAPLPEYTYEAKRRKLSGNGVCVVTVDAATGRVTDARMFQSTGSPMLDKLTIQTFKSWRFKPGTVSQIRVPISYE